VLAEGRTLDSFESGDVEDGNYGLVCDVQVAHEPGLLQRSLPVRALRFFDALDHHRVTLVLLSRSLEVLLVRRTIRLLLHLLDSFLAFDLLLLELGEA